MYISRKIVDFEIAVTFIWSNKGFLSSVKAIYVIVFTLQLGIRDVFEPRQRDFTPMTKQAGVYVRSIEQAVSVAIRKYRPDDQKKHSKP